MVMHVYCMAVHGFTQQTANVVKIHIFVCEVCDLSGYGGLDYISDDMIEGIFSSQFETDGKISCDMSIALRCDDAYHTHEFWRHSKVYQV